MVDTKLHHISTVGKLALSSRNTVNNIKDNTHTGSGSYFFEGLRERAWEEAEFENALRRMRISFGQVIEIG
jgi:hypothetical protein